MEPNYVGANGRIDAMAAAWLLDEDHVFFLDHEITWDGRNHGFAGAQVNSANMDEAPVLASNCKAIVDGVLDLMMTLEADEGLRVPRGEISSSLHGAIREGDLTGITLFNLIACGHAVKIVQAQKDAYQVIHDNRLARGIPAFYKLVARMIEGMRGYNGVSAPFQVTFGSARNFDADQYLEDFEGMVPGAVCESMWVERVGGAQEAEPPAPAAETPAAGDSGGTGTAGRWTFEQGKTAKGRRFSIGLPDQFAAVEGSGGRPLAVPVGDLEEGAPDYLESTQIIYSDMLGDLGEDVKASYRDALIPEARVQVNRQTMYGEAKNPLGGGVVDDWVLEGRNCLVQVFEVRLPSLLDGLGPGAREYYVKPVAFDHEDQLRITDSFDNLAPGQLRELALAVAATVELDSPVELKRMSELERCCGEAVSFDEFEDTVNGLRGLLVLGTGWRVSADCWKAIREAGEDPAVAASEMPRAVAESFNEALEERVGYFARLVDALEAQRNLGNPEFGAMWSLVGEFGDQLVADHIEIDGDEELSAKANATGIVRVPDRYARLREVWQALEPERATEAAEPEEGPASHRAREIVRLSRKAVWENLGIDADGSCGDGLAEFGEELVYALVKRGLHGSDAIVNGEWVAGNVPFPYDGDPVESAAALLGRLEERSQGGVVCRRGESYGVRFTLIEGFAAEQGMGDAAEELLAKELERAHGEISEVARELARLESEESSRIEAMTTLERATELGNHGAMAITMLKRDVASLESEVGRKPESHYEGLVRDAEAKAEKESERLERLQAERELLERELEALTGLFKGRARKEAAGNLERVSADIAAAESGRAAAEGDAETAKQLLDQHRAKAGELDEKRSRLEELESELEGRSAELIVENAFAARRRDFESKYADRGEEGAWRWISIPRDPFAMTEYRPRAVPTEFTKSEYMALEAIPELRRRGVERMTAEEIGRLCGKPPFDARVPGRSPAQKGPEARQLVARRLLEWGLLDMSTAAGAHSYAASARLVLCERNYGAEYFERVTGIDGARTDGYRYAYEHILEEQERQRVLEADARKVVAVLKSERDPLERSDLATRARAKGLKGSFDGAVKRAKELGEIKEFRVRRDVYYALIGWEPPCD